MLNDICCITAASRPKSVERVLSSQVARSVSNSFYMHHAVSSNVDEYHVLERIAIARALLRNPKVLLLDEVMSRAEHDTSETHCLHRLHRHWTLARKE